MFDCCLPLLISGGKSSTSKTPLPRRVVPVARKGGPPGGGRSTPSKRDSPSIVMAGKGGSITSITVGQVSRRMLMEFQILKLFKRDLLARIDLYSIDYING